MNAQQPVWRCVCVGFAIALGSSWVGLNAGCGSRTVSDQPDEAPATVNTLQEETFQPNDPEGHDILPASQWKGVDLLAVPLPDLSILGQAVQRQLRDSQASLADVCQQDNAPSARLSIAYGEMGKLYHAYDLLDAAEACYRNARALAPEDFRWPYYLADAYRLQGNPEKAIPMLEVALAVDHDSLHALLAMGEIQLAANRPNQAKPRFERALSLDPDCAPAMAGLGTIAASGRDFTAAIRHFEAALSRQPGATAVHYSLAMAYRGNGDLEKAKTHLEQRGDISPKLADPLLDELAKLMTGARHHEKSGVSAAKAGNLDEALSDLRLAVEGSPNSPSPRVNLGTVLALSGDSDGAIRQYREALRLQPTFPLAHCNLAVELAKLAENDAALKHFRQAIQRDPQYADAHLGLANLLAKTGDYQPAASHYARVIEIDPRNREARLGQAVALSRVGRHAEAYGRLKESRTALPESMILAHAMARQLATCPDKRFRDGKRALELAMAVFKILNSPEHAETVAMAYAEVGNFDEAVRWQSEIVEGAEKSGLDDLLVRARKNLTLYRDGRPCREPWPTHTGQMPPDPSS